MRRRRLYVSSTLHTYPHSCKDANCDVNYKRPTLHGACLLPSTPQSNGGVRRGRLSAVTAASVASKENFDVAAQHSFRPPTPSVTNFRPSFYIRTMAPLAPPSHGLASISAAASASNITLPVFPGGCTVELVHDSNSTIAACCALVGSTPNSQILPDGSTLSGCPYSPPLFFPTPQNQTAFTACAMERGAGSSCSPPLLAVTRAAIGDGAPQSLPFKLKVRWDRAGAVLVLAAVAMAAVIT
ncbi:hypothetical protein FB45DRAFT_943060 [Roridomyces roridus]|uniref:Uncharacterized protein n=1 Tax=Roridomyces roridus TaxID=1738132 RepID=A0AAD7B4H3_9AGAR|nr:hypothetical protein FB45DRAFT_943060 [Roridomyces roridus]